MDNQFLYAFLLTAFAGLSTGIGSAIALFTHHTNRKILSFSLGLSAGVMIYVSFVELLYEARIDLTALMGERPGNLVAAAAFFGGMLLAGMIDKLVPDIENPHEIRQVESMDGQGTTNSAATRQRLARMGLMTALAVTIHNFPEGIATFVAASDASGIGIAIAVAIAIHNIPEGIAVFIPIYFATQNKKKAFWYSFLSGVSEPVGAVVGYLLLMPFMTPEVMACLFAAVAGIMVYISLDELLPAAQEYGEHHLSIYGLVTGMAVMAASLILLI